MTYPWSSGDVLTAADLNAYAGLVLVKTQTVGTGVSSVTVTNAFSSTFDNYRITYNGGVASTGGNWLTVKFATSHTNGYYGAVWDITWTNTTYSQGVNNGAGVLVARTDTSASRMATSFDVFGPYLASGSTPLIGMGHGYLSYQSWSYEYAPAVSLTDIVFGVTAGTFTGGTIRVYGYNNG